MRKLSLREVKGILFLSFASTIAMVFHHSSSVSRRDSKNLVEYNLKTYSSAQCGLRVRMGWGEWMESEDDSNKPWLGPDGEGPKSNSKE